MDNQQVYTCPSCGYFTMDEWPGSYDICHICFWEDDPVQLLDPSYAGGANHPSLIEAQSNVMLYGACDLIGKEHAKGILPNDQKDPGWRLATELDVKNARTPGSLSRNEYDDLNVWYYWRRN